MCIYFNSHINLKFIIKMSYIIKKYLLQFLLNINGGDIN